MARTPLKMTIAEAHAEMIGFVNRVKAILTRCGGARV
jgi:hypothetical protein